MRIETSFPASCWRVGDDYKSRMKEAFAQHTARVRDVSPERASFMLAHLHDDEGTCLVQADGKDSFVTEWDDGDNS